MAVKNMWWRLCVPVIRSSMYNLFLFILISLSSSSSSSLSMFSVNALNQTSALIYEAPDECIWSSNNKNNNMKITTTTTNIDNNNNLILICHLRTINSELETTNFSVIKPQNTKNLRLECNSGLYFQSNLSPNSFTTLGELHELSIEYCKLSALVEGTFRGLTNLRNLSIRTHNEDWSTMSLDMSSNSFVELRKLQVLDLSHNNIWLIPDGLICGLHELQSLSVANNKLQDVMNFHFMGLPNGRARSNLVCGSTLRQLDLSGNKLTQLPALIFSGLMQLQVLNLAGNSMHYIADHAFDGLTALVHVDLAHNMLTSLPPELFNAAKSLEQIDLRNNSLNVLAPDLFSKLNYLRVLDMSANELNSQWINAATFVGLKSLVHLDLSRNKLSKLQTHIFRSLGKLQILKLEENFLEHLPDGIFANLSNLQTLVLSNNRIASLGPKGLSGLYALSLLSLDYNRLGQIDVQAFKDCTSLQDVYLNRNKITHIPETLRYVGGLKTLDLGENLISNMDNNSFALLSQLYGLRLTENRLTSLRRGTFDRLPALQILNLSGNQIKFIDQHVFAKNAQLQAIRLDGNQLTSIAAVLIELSNLVWLNISDNQLEILDYTHIPTNLQRLDVRANRLTQLINYVDLDRNLSLSNFDLSSNLLNEITANAIPNSVEVLLLNDNLIEHIQPYTFFKKVHLKMVDLRHNLLSTVEPNALRLSGLMMHGGLAWPKFYISQNPWQCDCKLDWLKRHNNNNMSHMQPTIVDLDQIYCKFAYMRSRGRQLLLESTIHNFLCKYETHCFALCHCCDYDACDCKMTCPHRCACYHDQTWSTNVVDCSRANYNGILPTQIPMDATQLYLDGNILNELTSHAFIGHKRLRVLHLNHTRMEVIRNRTFYGLLDLQVLQLNHNNLHSLQGFEFQGLENLAELYLQHNSLAYIDMLTFHGLNKLQILRLDHNYLSVYAAWNLLPNNLHELRLADNPWTCNCQFLIKFRNYLYDHNNNNNNNDNRMIIVDQHKLRCFAMDEQNINNNNHNNHQNNHNHSKLSEQFALNFINCGQNDTRNTLLLQQQHNGNNNNLTLENILAELGQLENNQYNNLHIILICLTCCMLIIIFSILIYIYRAELRAWLYAHFGMRLFDNTHKHIDLNAHDKLYDAYICYSIKDEQFVCEQIARVLEHDGKKHYKVCLHYRDNVQTTQISQAIDAASRTILILSDNFLKTEWQTYDFKLAYEALLRDSCKRLVIVVIGDLPKKLNPHHIHQDIGIDHNEHDNDNHDNDDILLAYLHNNSYLKWSENLFWEKLHFSLPDRPDHCYGQQHTIPSNHMVETINSHHHHHHLRHLHHPNHQRQNISQQQQQHPFSNINVGHQMSLQHQQQQQQQLAHHHHHNHIMPINQTIQQQQHYTPNPNNQQQQQQQQQHYQSQHNMNIVQLQNQHNRSLRHKYTEENFNSKYRHHANNKSISHSHTSSTNSNLLNSSSLSSTTVPALTTTMTLATTNTSTPTTILKSIQQQSLPPLPIVTSTMTNSPQTSNTSNVITSVSTIETATTPTIRESRTPATNI